jgi:AcrR family transcriptional regulator
MITQTKDVDPRVKRTRQLLQQAFLELFREKGFASITVQDIAERATVNRATFYAHYEDKYALMDSMLREYFQQMVGSKLSPMPQWGVGSLHILISAVFDFLNEVHKGCKPTYSQFDPFFERTVQEELYDLLVTWLQQVPPANIGRRVPVETIALVASWAIFGAAAQWSHGERAIPAEQMADYVLAVVAEGVVRLTSHPR